MPSEGLQFPARLLQLLQMMNDQTVLAKDVAIRAGVSVSTVSRAFTSGSAVREATRRRVLEVAREMDYQSPSARNMLALRSSTVLLVAGDLENPFYPIVAEHLALALAQTGRRLILCPVPNGGSVDDVMQQVLEEPTSAVIVTSAFLSSGLSRTFRERRIPLILFNRIQPDANATAVTCDNFDGGRIAARTLIERGCARIAVIEGRRNTSTQTERMRGFLSVLEHAGRTPFAVQSGDFDYATSVAAARDLLTCDTRPDGLFCVNDLMAFAALDTARHLGLRVPADLAVVGFDDVPMASWASYDLTTVRQPLRQMIRDTVDLLDIMAERGDDDEPYSSIRVSPVRLIRRSTV